MCGIQGLGSAAPAGGPCNYHMPELELDFASAEVAKALLLPDGCRKLMVHGLLAQKLLPVDFRQGSLPNMNHLLSINICFEQLVDFALSGGPLYL